MAIDLWLKDGLDDPTTLGFEKVLLPGEYEILEQGKTQETRKRIAEVRQEGKIPILSVKDLRSLRKAVMNRDTIILLKPEEFFANVHIARVSRSNSISFLILVKDLLEPSVEALRNIRKTVKIYRKQRILILLATGAEKPEEVRRPKDLAAVGVILGLSPEESLAAVDLWWKLALSPWRRLVGE